jgi:hypothetical protein
MTTAGFVELTEEYLARSNKHKFGLCFECEAPLDDKADFRFIYQPTRILCNACFDSYGLE